MTAATPAPAPSPASGECPLHEDTLEEPAPTRPAPTSTLRDQLAPDVSVGFVMDWSSQRPGAWQTEQRIIQALTGVRDQLDDIDSPGFHFRIRREHLQFAANDLARLVRKRLGMVAPLTISVGKITTGAHEIAGKKVRIDVHYPEGGSQAPEEGDSSAPSIMSPDDLKGFVLRYLQQELRAQLHSDGIFALTLRPSDDASNIPAGAEVDIQIEGKYYVFIAKKNNHILHFVRKVLDDTLRS
jgi:hypothetical protein